MRVQTFAYHTQLIYQTLPALSSVENGYLLVPEAGLWYSFPNGMKERNDMEFYGTLGPGCADADTLERMLRLGMTGVRLNLSHTALRAASPLLRALRTAADRCGVQPKLVIDMQGPELRVGALDGPVTLPEGGTVVLGGAGIPVPDLVLPALTAGQQVLLDDGKLLLEVTEPAPGGGARAAVLRGGVLQSRKSIALPGADIRPPAVTETDRANLRDATALGVTAVMQPFVRDREDLMDLRRAMEQAGWGGLRLLAKIENLDGVERLGELLPAADEIVIARGDLGNAAPLWELPALQKRIAAACRAAGKPFMVVTQMLSSMEHSPVPTRAEVSDVFNAVLDGAASLMVTGETAMGQYSAEVIRYLVSTAHEAENYLRG